MRWLRAAALLLGATAGTACRTPHSARPDNPARAEWVVHIKDFQFQPAQLTVRVGDVVVWVNDDGFRHSSVADNNAWATRELDRGQRSPWSPQTPGHYRYHCSAHPTMWAALTVTAVPPGT